MKLEKLNVRELTNNEIDAVSGAGGQLTAEASQKAGDPPVYKIDAVINF